jgi:hypothetical protein
MERGTDHFAGTAAIALVRINPDHLDFFPDFTHFE